ncbi:acyltransferase (plasmid) [Entomospira entomophila]|uniref:Acyltransferase n=1 Tax=Entomospira entomophila TaxID=2719988 RepID=A0A968KUD0_9SPIO|nr:acyltransferase [Entomospira entomophilus]NIZ41341.1 acyltransferase [Entomospira entomophilus]WDI36248.1 acyltransferase [Entomospira entomophilus]
MQQRDGTLDIAKGFAVIFMVYVHVLIAFGSKEVQEEHLFGVIVELLGGIPAAPVFMFMLGAGVHFSRRSTPANLARRGLKLLIGGYLFNFFRSVLPALLQWHFADVALPHDHTHMSYSMEILYYYLFFVDILQFAGMTFLFFALMRKLQSPLWLYSLLIVLFWIINHSLSTLNIPFNRWLTPWYALWFGIDDSSYFPFFTWIFYPILGYYSAIILQQTKNRKTLYFRIFGITSIILFGYLLGIWLLGLPTGYESNRVYYHHHFPVHIFYGSWILWWIATLFFLFRTPSIHSRILVDIGKMTTKIYIIHFLIIGFLSIFIQQISSAWIIFITSSILLLLSYFFATFLGRFMDKRS